MKQQTITQKDGKWCCDEPGWVPHTTLEMEAEQFPKGTVIIVKFPERVYRTGNTSCRFCGGLGYTWEDTDDPQIMSRHICKCVREIVDAMKRGER